MNLQQKIQWKEAWTLLSRHSHSLQQQQYSRGEQLWGKSPSLKECLHRITSLLSPLLWKGDKMCSPNTPDAINTKIIECVSWVELNWIHTNDKKWCFPSSSMSSANWESMEIHLSISNKTTKWWWVMILIHWCMIGTSLCWRPINNREKTVFQVTV